MRDGMNNWRIQPLYSANAADNGGGVLKNDPKEKQKQRVIGVIEKRIAKGGEEKVNNALGIFVSYLRDGKTLQEAAKDVMDSHNDSDATEKVTKEAFAGALVEEGILTAVELGREAFPPASQGEGAAGGPGEVVEGVGDSLGDSLTEQLIAGLVQETLDCYKRNEDECRLKVQEVRAALNDGDFTEYSRLLAEESIHTDRYLPTEPPPGPDVDTPDVPVADVIPADESKADREERLTEEAKQAFIHYQNDDDDGAAFITEMAGRLSKRDLAVVRRKLKAFGITINGIDHDEPERGPDEEDLSKLTTIEALKAKFGPYEKLGDKVPYWILPNGDALVKEVRNEGPHRIKPSSTRKIHGVWYHYADRKFTEATQEQITTEEQRRAAQSRPRVRPRDAAGPERTPRRREAEAAQDRLVNPNALASMTLKFAERYKADDFKTTEPAFWHAVTGKSKAEIDAWLDMVGQRRERLKGDAKKSLPPRATFDSIRAAGRNARRSDQGERNISPGEGRGERRREREPQTPEKPKLTVAESLEALRSLRKKLGLD